MNASVSLYEDQELSYAFKSRPNSSSGNSPNDNNSTRARFGRRAKAPQSFNGMHRRRKKKIRW